MANYGSNSIAIFGYDKEKVDGLRDLMVKFLHENSTSSIRAFVVACGYSSDEALKMTDGRDASSSIFHGAESVRHIDEKPGFGVEAGNFFALFRVYITMWISLWKVCKTLKYQGFTR